MSSQPTRRYFLKAGGAAAGTAWAGFASLAAVSADEVQAAPELVRFNPQIEPVVQLIEQTPRDRCVAAMIEQLRQGLPYRQFLAALYLAAIRAARWHGSGVHGFDHNA